MGETTEISWCDHTFNFVWGCTKVSEACKHCYAETWSKRVGLKVWGQEAPRRTFGEKHWAEPLAWNARAKRDDVRRRVFCSSMADVFEDHPTVAEERKKLWPLIDRTTHLDWMLLTKRPENMVSFAPEAWRAGWPANVWAGTTCENQERYNERIEHLARVPAAIRFLSCEPLLGPIALGLLGTAPKDWGHGYVGLYDLIHLVITGGESGPHARPMHPDWVRSIRDECVETKVAFHHKQWGEWGPLDPGGDWQGVERCLRSSGEVVGAAGGRGSQRRGTALDGSDTPDAAWLYRVGKKKAGRLLDGREWSEFPGARS